MTPSDGAMALPADAWRTERALHREMVIALDFGSRDVLRPAGS